VPKWTVRLRLTLLYSGLFFISGVVLLAITYLVFRNAAGVNLIFSNGPVDGANDAATKANLARVREMYAGAVARNTDLVHHGLIRSLIVLAIMTLASIGLGWLVAGRVLRPLRTMTAKTRQISERNLNQRLALTGPRDELKDLADTIDGLLARLETHVAAQQRFAANASHELRTPLALTQTLLEVARNDPERVDGALVDRLHEVNTRAIDLTEALLVLSRADQRSFTRESVDLSLLVEEAVETLLPFAAERRVAIETAGAPTFALGSQPLLLQLTTNLVQNAIVHNLPEGGTVWARTSADAEGATLTVENTGERLAPELVATLDEPFLRGSERARTGQAGVGLGLAIVRSIAEAHDGTLTLVAREGGGLRVTVRLPAP
jgi:two-component system sensor histidine kinase VanS